MEEGERGRGGGEQKHTTLQERFSYYVGHVCDFQILRMHGPPSRKAVRYFFPYQAKAKPGTGFEGNKLIYWYRTHAPKAILIPSLYGGHGWHYTYFDGKK